AVEQPPRTLTFSGPRKAKIVVSPFYTEWSSRFSK
ncbi:hypothetical protein L917_02671, partial [Phytophthora nicotianae]